MSGILNGLKIYAEAEVIKAKVEDNEEEQAE